jgi:shikimate dehydrogenase
MLELNLSISGKTQVWGIIGDPLKHTISPAMHNAAFEKLGMDYVYVPFPVKKDDLAEALQGIRALNIRGVNVTIPHKVQVMPFLDNIDELARDIGAVNTVINQNGELKGYNTDAAGFWRVLETAKVQLPGKKVVLLGAGGAARAIAFMLADKGADLTILNRNLEKAELLVDLITTTFGKSIPALELTSDNLGLTLGETDILINATSVGMHPKNRETTVPAKLLKPNMIVFDIIYNPAKTRLLADAEKRGAKIINGVEMLVWQGAVAFELWTGKPAPVDVMREAAIKALGEHEK